MKEYHSDILYYPHDKDVIDWGTLKVPEHLKDVAENPFEGEQRYFESRRITFRESDAPVVYSALNGISFERLEESLKNLPTILNRGSYEIEKIPIVRGWMELLRCVFLDRENPRKGMEAMNQAMDNLKKGYSVIVFPEGTRSKGSELDLNEFKAGAFRIATKTKVPVVPVAIHASRDIMENNGGWMKPTHVTIQILSPISTMDMDKEQLRQIPQLTQQKILEQLQKMQ